MAKVTIASVAFASAVACVLGVVAEFGQGPPRVATETARPTQPRTGTVELAGSGSNVALTRLLVRAWCAQRPTCAVVHESVGSAGALRALRDGVIDVALVSRPPTPDELHGGLRVTPYARTPVVIAANLSVPARNLARSEILEVLRGSRTRWGNGTPLLFVLRERGDSSLRAMATAIAGWPEAEEAAQRARRFRVMYGDRELRDTVAETQGAIGVTDLGGMRLEGQHLVALALDGVAPSLEALATGRYPIAKTLAFVTRPDARPEALALVAYATSAAAAGIIREADYLPEAAR